MKKPKRDRGPKLSSAIAQPQMMMTSGVRQGVPEAGRRSSAITAIDFPQYESAPGIPRATTLQGVNASAWKAQGVGWKNYRRRAALQNRRVQFEQTRRVQFLTVV